MSHGKSSEENNCLLLRRQQEHKDVYGVIELNRPLTLSVERGQGGSIQSDHQVHYSGEEHTGVQTHTNSQMIVCSIT